MWIPLFMLYSKFLFGRHTNPQLAMLQDFAEVRIDFRNFLKSSLLRESTKKVHLNFRVSLWKRKFKDFDIRRSFSNIFLASKIELDRPKLMTAIVTDQLLNTGPHKVQFWVHCFLTLTWFIFYITMKIVRLKITLLIQLHIPVPLKFPMSTENYSLNQQFF